MTLVVPFTIIEVIRSFLYIYIQGLLWGIVFSNLIDHYPERKRRCDGNELVLKDFQTKEAYDHWHQARSNILTSFKVTP